MKKYSEYWIKEIADNEEFNYEWFCRDEDPEDDSVYVFNTETTNNGPCFMSVGVWYWVKDLNKFASWIIEFQMRNIYSCCYEGKTMKETLDQTGVDYLRKIAKEYDSEVCAAVLALAEELQGRIDAGTLTFDVFADWIKRYEKISEDMPVLVEFKLFEGVDAAMELLQKHESNQGEDRENLTLIERFQADFTG